MRHFSFPNALSTCSRVAATRLLALVLGVGLVCSAPLAQAEVLRSQVIQLHAGWNAVYLEVDPVNPAPATVFAGVPTDTVATFNTEPKPVHYPRNPEQHPWQEEGWDVWYAPQRPESFLSSLNSIRGQRAYLIKASADHAWTISGRVIRRDIVWQPDSFTFTGFSVDPQSPPTFARFFAGAQAHRGQQVFRLVDGRWTLVRDAAQTQLRSGEAYWIFSEGASDFQGPVGVKPSVGDKLAFGASANVLRLDFANASGAATPVWIETVPVGDPLPLSYEFRDLKNLILSYPSLPPVHALPMLGPSERMVLRLAVRREAMTSASQSALLKIINADGFVVWIPVEADRTTP